MLEEMGLVMSQVTTWLQDFKRSGLLVNHWNSATQRHAGVLSLFKKTIFE
jgi:hypothetical protein